MCTYIYWYTQRVGGEGRELPSDMKCPLPLLRLPCPTSARARKKAYNAERLSFPQIHFQRRKPEQCIAKATVPFWNQKQPFTFPLVSGSDPGKGLTTFFSCCNMVITHHRDAVTEPPTTFCPLRSHATTAGVPPPPEAASVCGGSRPQQLPP